MGRNLAGLGLGRIVLKGLLFVVLPIAAAISIWRQHHYSGALLTGWFFAAVGVGLLSDVLLWGAWTLTPNRWAQGILASLGLLTFGPREAWRGTAFRVFGTNGRLWVFCLLLVPVGLFLKMRLSSWPKWPVLYVPVTVVTLDESAGVGPAMPFGFTLALPAKAKVWSFSQSGSFVLNTSNQSTVIVDRDNLWDAAMEGTPFGHAALPAFMEERFGAVPTLLKSVAWPHPSVFMRLQGKGILAYGAIWPGKRPGKQGLSIAIWDDHLKPLGSLSATWTGSQASTMQWLRTLRAESPDQAGSPGRHLTPLEAKSMSDTDLVSAAFREPGNVSVLAVIQERTMAVRRKAGLP